MLSLAPGQGGTFGYSQMVKDFKGENVLQANPKHAKVRHLVTFGKDVKFIGTQGCVTCVGVYFEIDSNRIFCAHINAWSQTGVDHYYVMSPARKEWKEIREAIKGQLAEHADLHGWEALDVRVETIILTCPRMPAAGAAVVAGICDFLGIPLHRQPNVKLAHGFIVVPGARTGLGMQQVKYLTSSWNFEGAQWREDFDMPKEFVTVPYASKGLLVEQTLSYTVGEGFHTIVDPTGTRPP